MEWMILPLKRYFDFAGRSRRMEFWMFQLFVTLVNIVLAGFVLSGLPWSRMIDEETSQIDPASFEGIGVGFWLGMALLTIFWLAMFIPSLAVTVRRLHDRDLSGWWYGGLLIASFIPIINIISWIGFIVLLVIFFLPGTPGPNRFGPDPKDPTQAGIFA